MKKILGLIISIMLIIAMMPVTDIYAEATSSGESNGEATIIASGNFGNGLFWSVDSKGQLVISGEGKMPDYGRVSGTEKPWNSYAFSEIKIDKGITHIGNYAFYNKSAVKKLEISDGVKNIGNSAFKSCSGIESVIIPGSVNCIGYDAFEECSGLQTVIIQDGTKSIYPYVFEDCENLKEIHLPESVEEIGWNAFYNCKSLISIDLPSKITKIEHDTFYGCSNLENVGAMENVTEIGMRAFYGSGLREITIPKNVNSIGDYAFASCENLKEVMIHESSPSVGTHAFWNSSNVTIYSNPNTDIYWYAKNNDIQFRCLGHSWVTSDGSVPEKGCLDNENGVLHCKYCDVVKEKPGHNYDEGIVNKEPTYKEPGTKLFTCIDCGDIYIEEIPKLDYPSLESEIVRYAGAGRYDTAMLAADALKELNGVSKFDSILVASGMNYPDALAGSYLAKAEDAPILLVGPGFEENVKDYIVENLASGGKVYILGGTGVVTPAFEASLTDSGITVDRCAGSGRYETNIRILEAANAREGDLLVCAGTGFADSLSASAAGLPIMLVGPTMTSVQTDYLDKMDVDNIYLVGGTGAVSLDVETYFVDRYGTDKVFRFAGKTRYETSAMVAEAFYPEAESAVLAYALNFPDGLSGGPVAMALGAPLLLVDNNAYAAAEAYADKAGINSAVILGGPTLISDEVAKSIIR